jgi:hypothetical protein
MSDHLQTAGQLSVDAHADWATVSASVHSSQSDLDSIRERGDKSWDEALHNLRLHGIMHGDNCPSFGSYNSFHADKDDCLDQPQVCLGEDFEPLNKMHKRKLLEKFISRLAIIMLIAFSSFAVGSLYGFHMGQDTPKITADELAAQLHRLDELEKQNTQK